VKRIVSALRRARGFKLVRTMTPEDYHSRHVSREHLTTTELLVITAGFAAAIAVAMALLAIVGYHAEILSAVCGRLS
jgi:hypothetical protein